MKRLLLLMAAVLVASPAIAASITLTPVVPPTETGENSAGSQQITDTARLKVGSGTCTIAVASSAGACTLNNAAGQITLSSATAGASGATPTVLTITDDKVQLGDMIQCTIDNTGATAAATLVCYPHVTAGQFTLEIQDGSTTALASSPLNIYFLVNTMGNPN